MELEKLAAAAAIAAVTELAKSGAAGAQAAGGVVWAWIRSKAPRSRDAILEEVEREPNAAGAKEDLRAILKRTLDGNAELQAELQVLLEKSKQRLATAQSFTVEGDNNKLAGVIGDGNNTNIS